MFGRAPPTSLEGPPLSSGGVSVIIEEVEEGEEGTGDDDTVGPLFNGKRCIISCVFVLFRLTVLSTCIYILCTWLYMYIVRTCGLLCMYIATFKSRWCLDFFNYFVLIGSCKIHLLPLLFASEIGKKARFRNFFHYAYVSNR